MKTNNLIIAVITAILLALSTNGNAQNRIVGGNYVDITERPFQAAVFVDYGRSFGSGAILDHQWVATAKHVVANATPERIRVDVGQNDIADFGIGGKQISQIILHPTYDIALLKLTYPLTYSESVKPIKCASGTYSANTPVTVSGWGNTSLTDTIFNFSRLKQATLTIRNYSNGQIYTNPSENMPLSGDSGGPLTVNSGNTIQLVGLHTNHYLDATNMPCIAVSIANVYSWIMQNIYPSGTNNITGNNLIPSTPTTFAYSYSCPMSEIELGPNLEELSRTSNSITVRSTGNGPSYLRICDNGNTIINKTVWCGIPVIFGIVYDGRLLRVLANRDAGIYYTEWRIGGSQFSAYDDFIYPSYLPSGTQLVTVRARNGNGYSDYYSEYIDFNNNGSFYMTTNANSRLIAVTPAEESVSDEPIEYVVSDIIKGNPVLSGSLPPAGGTIDCSQLKKGTYAIRLMNNKNQLSKKISL